MARDRRREDDPHADRVRLISRLVRSWRHRVAVAGHSMEPTLHDGDWVLVDPEPRPPAVGELVVAEDPRQAGRLLVKRVRSVDAESSLVIGGDHPAHADEEIRVSLAAVRGRPWLSYWPVRRVGRIR